MTDRPHRAGRMALRMGCIALLIALAFLAPKLFTSRSARIPGLMADERVLLRIWVVDAPGGAQSWLTGQLRAWEKQHPGVTTYLRSVSTADLADEAAVLPDLVLYMPGNLTAPETHFLPLSGEAVARSGVLREELLRSGRHQGQQYGLPLCWGAWVLAIDSALEPGSAETPAPTTLLGKPAVPQEASPTEAPLYPLPAASKADCALQSPSGAALFALGTLLEPLDRPPLPDNFGQLPSGEIYSGFQRHAWATAMLTTGQMTALTALTSAGSGFPFRVMTPPEVITDQVWLGSITEDAPAQAALLLAHLTSAKAQEALAAQGLYPARNDLTLYAAGPAAQVEASAHRGLTAINAYAAPADAASAAWRFFHGQIDLDEALLPLL